MVEKIQEFDKSFKYVEKSINKNPIVQFMCIFIYYIEHLKKKLILRELIVSYEQHIQ